MKKLTVLYLILFCGLAQGEWNRIETIQNVYTDDVRNVFFIDTLHGWLFGGRLDMATPYLAKSTNGGSFWYEQLADSRLAYIHDIYFINNNVGWIVGESKPSYGDSLGLIYKTEDGGLTWHLILEDKQIFYPQKIIFPTVNVGYIFSSSSRTSTNSSEGYAAIWRTKDGGNTWIKDHLDSFNKYFCDVHFINTDTGWAVGGHRWGNNSDGFIMRTVNGGESWDLMPVIDTTGASTVTSVFFINNKKGWVGGSIRVGDGDLWGFVAHTEDGGGTWGKYVLPDTMNWEPNFSKIYYHSDSTGWVVGYRMLFYTVNGGMYWNITRLNGNFIRSAFFLNTNYAWLIMKDHNPELMIYKTKDNGGYSQNVSVKPVLHQKSQSLQPFNITLLSASNSMTNINYRLDRDVSMSLSVYNLKGSKIAFQPQRFHAKGKHKFSVKIPKGFYVVEAKTYNGAKEVKFTQKILVR